MSDITKTKYNIRKDPFTEADESILIEHELITIPAASPFYIELEEIPRQEDPSTVLIYLTDVLAEDVDISEPLIDIGDGSQWEVDDVWLVDNEQMLVTGKAGNTITVTRGYGGTTPATHTNGTRFRKLTPWTEVYTAPSQGEYQVHYGTIAIPYRKGLVRFNEDDAEKELWCDYYGTGHGNMAEHINDIQDELAVIDADGWVTYERLENYAPGDWLTAYSDTERTVTGGGVFTKKKEIQIKKNGTLRIKFDLNGVGGTVYGAIYRNGVLVGTQQVNGSHVYETHSEDIAGWSKDDLVQIYLWAGTGDTTYVRNFRLYCKFPSGEIVTLD